MAKKNEIALQNMGQLMEKHGDTMQQMGITAMSFNTMAVVKKTNQLKKEKTHLDKEVSELEAKRAGVNKKIAKIVTDIGKTIKAPAEKEFLAFCKAVKLKKACTSVRVDRYIHEKKGNCLRVTSSYDRDSSNNYSSSEYTTVNLKGLPKSIKVLDAEYASLTEELTKVNSEVMEVRVKLQNIGELERNANAHTTHNLLSQTEDGAKLLHSLGLEDLE